MFARLGRPARLDSLNHSYEIMRRGRERERRNVQEEKWRMERGGGGGEREGGGGGEREGGGRGSAWGGRVRVVVAGERERRFFSNAAEAKRPFLVEGGFEREPAILTV